MCPFHVKLISYALCPVSVKFRSGIYTRLSEELGRHRGREGKTECSLCGNECENVSHVLWECSAYSSTRA